MEYRADVSVFDGIDWWWGTSLLRALRFLRSRRSKVLLGRRRILKAPRHRRDCRSISQADDLFRVVAAEKCDALDIPDAPLRAFRTPDGSITAFATHYRNRSLVGRGFDTLAKDCSVAYEGSLDPDPSHFDYKTWIAATWIADDGSVVALGHNEYQAHELPGRCRFSFAAI